MKLTLVHLTIALAAATATPVFTLDDLGQFEELDVDIANIGSNDVTSTTWGEGASAGSDTISTNDGTLSAAITAALTAGGTSHTSLSGPDIPSWLRVTLTSSSGTTITVIVKGKAKGTELFPRC